MRLPRPDRRLSMGFLELEGATWACTLNIRPDGEDGYRGHLSYRSDGGGVEAAEVRTAEIFVEQTAAEIRERALGLGRPLLGALLASARHAARTRPAPSVQVGVTATAEDGLDPVGGEGLA